MALAVCVAALALPGALTSCSSSSTATTANAEVGQPGGPVRVGVAEFATLTGSPDVQVIDVRELSERGGNAFTLQPGDVVTVPERYF